MHVNSINVNQAWKDVMVRALTRRGDWVEKPSRNGPTLMHDGPFSMTIRCPRERVLFSASRNANPFFHVMEVVWMMAGAKHVAWLAQFNKRMNEYADLGTIWGAYGHRWARYFDFNQLKYAVDKLIMDPNTRQAVVAMWDGYADLTTSAKDRPCNISVQFRTGSNPERLDMFVFNRSNDVVWGMLGANVVHMTYLHEIVAHYAGMRVGAYHVLSSTAHIYTDLPSLPLIQQQLLVEPDPYDDDAEPLVFDPGMGLDNIEAFQAACDDFITKAHVWPGGWLHEVARPIYTAWGQPYDEAMKTCEDIEASDWRMACQNWLTRNRLKAPTTRGSSSSTGTSQS